MLSSEEVNLLIHSDLNFNSIRPLPWCQSPFHDISFSLQSIQIIRAKFHLRSWGGTRNGKKHRISNGKALRQNEPLQFPYFSLLFAIFIAWFIYNLLEIKTGSGTYYLYLVDTYTSRWSAMTNCNLVESPSVKLADINTDVEAQLIGDAVSNWSSFAGLSTSK